MIEAVSIMARYFQTKRRLRWDRARIDAWQRLSLAANVGSHSAAQTTEEILGRFPVLDHHGYRERFALFNRAGISLDEAYLKARNELAGHPEANGELSFGLSTGTSGRPSVFVTSDAERRAYIANFMAKVLRPRDVPGCRAALLLKNANRLYSDAGRSGLVNLIYFDICKPLQTWIDRLCELRPHVMIGPTSILLDIARSRAFQLLPFHPHTLLAGAEPLFPSERARLHTAFGTAPRAVYQATEGFIAVECKHGRLHLNEDILIAEWQRFAETCERAVPVITDFTRTSQTIRRLRIDDVVALSEAPCPCGSHYGAIDRVEGRLSDVLYGNCVNRPVKPVFPFDAEYRLSEDLDPLGEWTICQEESTDITVGTQSPPSPPVLRRVRDTLSDLGLSPRADIARLDSRPPQVKRRRFIRQFDPDSRRIVELLLLPPRRQFPR